MLKTNSKLVRENITNYIVSWSRDYIADQYGRELETDADVLRAVYEIFIDEKRHDFNWGKVPEIDVFSDWASGLALGGLFCYYYNRSAVDDLGSILDETDAERERYTETDAENMLTRLIYRETSRAYSRRNK